MQQVWLIKNNTNKEGRKDICSYFHMDVHFLQITVDPIPNTVPFENLSALHLLPKRLCSFIPVVCDYCQVVLCIQHTNEHFMLICSKYQQNGKDDTGCLVPVITFTTALISFKYLYFYPDNNVSLLLISLQLNHKNLWSHLGTRISCGAASCRRQCISELCTASCLFVLGVSAPASLATFQRP